MIHFCPAPGGPFVPEVQIPLGAPGPFRHCLRQASFPSLTRSGYRPGDGGFFTRRLRLKYVLRDGDVLSDCAYHIGHLRDVHHLGTSYGNRPTLTPRLLPTYHTYPTLAGCRRGSGSSGRSAANPRVGRSPYRAGTNTAGSWFVLPSTHTCGLSPNAPLTDKRRYGQADPGPAPTLVCDKGAWGVPCLGSVRVTSPSALTSTWFTNLGPDGHSPLVCGCQLIWLFSQIPVPLAASPASSCLVPLEQANPSDPGRCPGSCPTHPRQILLICWVGRDGVKGSTDPISTLSPGTGHFSPLSPPPRPGLYWNNLT